MTRVSSAWCVIGLLGLLVRCPDCRASGWQRRPRLAHDRTVQFGRDHDKPRGREPHPRPARKELPSMASVAPTDRAHRAAKRYIYAWGGGAAEGDATMRDLLGGKGAGLAEMTNAGLPVPPGFTITTEACNDYFTAGEKLPDGLWDDVLEAVKEVEARTGKGFGNAADPLLVSVRSGAKFSMPGMMDTVLNVGLNPSTLAGIAKLTNNERFAWDAYRRLIQMFGKTVKGIEGHKFEAILTRYKAKTKGKQDTDLTTEMLKDVVKDFKVLYKKELGVD